MTDINSFAITPKKIAILILATAAYFISSFAKSVSPPHIAGLLAQGDVLISVYITVKVQRIGYYYSLCFNLLSFFTALNVVFLSNMHETIPGIAVPASTILITSLIAAKNRIMSLSHIRLLRQQKDLSEAKAEAEKANRVKSDFLSSMSHEIRTPLNNILGYIELISLGQLDKTQKEYLSIIETSSKNLVRIINDILDFSKITENKLSIVSEPFDPIETINHTIRLFELTTLKKNILLDFKHTDVPHCIGDSLRLHQVILNLLANAIKFTPSGGNIKVELYAEIINSSATLNFSVSDTGIGIPQEKQSKIFDPFEQVDPSVPQNFGGTGLGLAVSRNIVNLMGGNLSVESEFGVGSRFFFSLNLPIAIKKEENMAETNISNQSSNIKSMHALIAEDTPESRELLIKMLGTLGISCDPASNGKEAYELFTKNKYDAVILDGYMPEMDGMTAARKIREHENQNSKQRTPIIALSARALSSERDEFINAGADHFIVKPVSFESLSDGLSRFAPRIHTKQPEGNSASFFAKLSAFLGIPESSVVSVFEGFQKSTLPQYISEIKNALKPLEREKLMRAAHRLRGSSASLLLEELASACSLLEESSKFENPEEIIKKAEKIFREAEKISELKFYY